MKLPLRSVGATIADADNMLIAIMNPANLPIKECEIDAICSFTRPT